MASGTSHHRGSPPALGDLGRQCPERHNLGGGDPQNIGLTRVLGVSMDFILSTATVSLQDRLLGLYDEGQRFVQMAATTEVRFSLLHIILAAALLGVWILYMASRRGRPVYLLGFEVYKPPNRLKITRQRFLELSRLSNAFNEKSIEFQEKMIFRGGLFIVLKF